MSRLTSASICFWCGSLASIYAQSLPIVTGVEHQPLAAQVGRVLDALRTTGEPLPDEPQIRRLLEPSNASPESVAKLQELLDGHCLAGVEINPESRVKAVQGSAPARLVQHGWRTFLIKVHNQAGITPVLAVNSPNSWPLANSPQDLIGVRWMEIVVFQKPPLKPHLSGLALEYRIVQLSSRDAGQREGKLRFDVGQGTQDLGFRGETDVLFQIQPAQPLTLKVKDTNGQPVMAAFLVKDTLGRVYPSQAKRLPPDFFFQQQVYRADGESLLLPAGRYTVECTRGPEYLRQVRTVAMGERPQEISFTLERWIDPAKLGWVSGDHHIHAAGCAHFDRPSEGVYPQDMMRHVLGEDLKMGSVLTWGPGWYFQKTFFEGKDNNLSTPDVKLRYDVEVSGFPSSHTGHIVLLGVKEQDYPGTKRIEDWPSWGLPVLQWAKQQGAIVGFPHTGWGLQVKETKLPSQEMPRFDGIGANEYIVSVAHNAVDFISAVDTPYPWELNIWYHTLNVGFRTRLSGETDFPCIYEGRVGLGRSYVQQTGLRRYQDWIEGIRQGRAYVSDGKSHLLNFAVNGTPLGGADVALPASGTVEITAQVAALLDEAPDETVRKLPLDEKPYWDLERSRLGATRRVPVELIVNGEAVARQEILADGSMQPVRFRQSISRSSWVALRILPSSHTNPIWVTVGGQPVRASKSSAEWCLRAVDQCWRAKQDNIRLSERGAAAQAYEEARRVYRQRLAETR